MIIQRHAGIGKRRIQSFLSFRSIQERAFPNDHHIGDDSKRPYILFFAEVTFTAEDFWASIVQGSTERIPATLFNQPRTSKVDKQASAAWAENHVLVLDVSMDDSLGMKEVEGIGYLTKVCPNHVWRETIWVTFYKFEEIGWGSRFHVDRGDAWHNKVIVVDIFKKVEQRADIGMALDLGAFYPVVVGVFGSRFQKSSGVPWPANRKRVRRRGDGRHYVNFYGYRSVLGVSLPAVRKDTRLDDLFDDYGRTAWTVELHLPGTFHEAIRTPADLPFDYEFRDASFGEESIGLAVGVGGPNASDTEEACSTV